MMPWLVVGTWLVGAMLSFWFFELRAQSSSEIKVVTFFDSDAETRQAEDWLRTLTSEHAVESQAQGTVVHILRPGCSCNRFTEPHIQKIAASYGTRGFQFVRATGALPPWVRGTPAAMVFDGAGKLVYFGPYSDSAWCGTSGAQVERVLDQLLAGKSPRPQRMLTRGCFCGDEEI